MGDVVAGHDVLVDLVSMVVGRTRDRAATNKKVFRINMQKDI